MLNIMCMECKKFKNGCEATECQSWTGCIYKETDRDIMTRYQLALKRIGTLNLLKLPEEVKDILKQATDFKTKVLMLEEVAKNF